MSQTPASSQEIVLTASFEISQTVSNLGIMLAALRHGVDTELLPRIATRVRDKHRARVERTKTGPDGKVWKKRKSKRFRHGLLTKSRTLLRGIRKARIGPNHWSVGTNVPYTKFHQKGTRRMSQRMIFGLNSTDEKDIEDMIDAWTMRHVSRLQVLARSLRKR
jgi:phage virion morphogenesis protein